MLDGLGLNITVISYGDKLEFGIVADREQLDDPWPLLDALADALAELREHVTGATDSASQTDKQKEQR